MIVLWRVTQRCNLTCPFCVYDRRVNSQRREADGFAIRRFGTVLSEYQRVTGDQVLVSWIGGEPFLFPDLSELTVLFKETLRLRISATTNGTMLSSPKVREHILAHYDELTVSVDGIGSVHNELRGWRGGYYRLRKAVVQLAETRQKREEPRLRANVVLMRQTMRDFERLCLELASWGFDEISFNQLGGRDRPEFFPAHRLRAEDTAWLTNEIPLLRARLAGLGVRLTGGDDYLLRIRATSRNEKISVADCRPGQQFLFISEDSVVSPCNFTTQEYGVALHELDCVETLRELPERFAQLQAKRRLAACADCHSTHVFAKFAA